MNETGDGVDENELAPDLNAQLWEIVAAVHAAEANWRFDDRLDLAARMRPWQPRGAGS